MFKVIQSRSLYLLISLLLFFILNPIIAESSSTRYVFTALFAILLVSSVYAIQHSRALIITSIALAAGIFLGHIANDVWFGDYVLELYENFLSIIFFGFIIITMLSYILKDKEITVDVICASVCVYLLMGLLWRYMYSIIYYLDANAFHPQYDVDVGGLSLALDFTYYSFTTLTTLGYGDIVAVSAIAKTFSWLEAVTGQIYLTVLVAHIIGLYVGLKKAG